MAASAKNKLGDLGSTGMIEQIHVSPVDPNLVFFIGSEGINWFSEDCGNSFKALNNQRKIHDF